jgi:hypothetical protein
LLIEVRGARYHSVKNVKACGCTCLLTTITRPSLQGIAVYTGNVYEAPALKPRQNFATSPSSAGPQFKSGQQAEILPFCRSIFRLQTFDKAVYLGVALVDVRLDRRRASPAVLPRRLWQVVGWVGFLLDMIGGVESALWEGCYPASALAMGSV